MADDIAVTPGSGATVRADEVGNKKYQVVKLDVGGAGSSNPVTDDDPLPVEVTYAQPANLVSGVTSDITDTTPTEVIGAQGAGIVVYLTSLLVTNSSTGTFVEITDGSGGTILWTGYADEGGGFSITFPAPLKFTANTAVYVECAGACNVRVSACGYKV